MVSTQTDIQGFYLHRYGFYTRAERVADGRRHDEIFEFPSSWEGSSE
jgi:hypothetical protein